MSHDHDQRRRTGGTSSEQDTTAPGKRALTDRLPVQAKARDPVSFDQSGEYRESRATITGPARDPLDFLDDDRRERRGHGHGRGHGHRHGHGHGQPHGAPHSQPHGGNTGAGDQPAHGPVLRGEITRKQALADGGPWQSELAALIMGHTVDDTATFTLEWPSGRAHSHGQLALVERSASHVVLKSRLPVEDIPDGSKVRIEQAAGGPEVHGDGSLGADDLSRLEA